MYKRRTNIDREDRGISTPLRRTRLLINSDYAKELEQAIIKAKTSVYLVFYNYGFPLDDPAGGVFLLTQKLLRKYKSGVDVRIIVNSGKEAVNLRGMGLNARTLNDNTMLHAKCLSIDSEVLFLGSHNMTARAHHYNLEISAMLYELEPILQFQNYFNTLWQHSG